MAAFRHASQRVTVRNFWLCEQLAQWDFQIVQRAYCFRLSLSENKAMQNHTELLEKGGGLIWTKSLPGSSA